MYLDETSVCIVDDGGTCVAKAKGPSAPATLADYLHVTGLSFGRVGLEACPFWQWLYSGLAGAGFPVVCIEVRRARAALSAMINKTDRNDARGIAQMVRTGSFQLVHVKTTESHELRFLLVARKLLLKQQYEIESCIRGSLKEFGLKIGVVTNRMSKRVRELIDERPLSTSQASWRTSAVRCLHLALACTRFRRHRVRCFNGTGGGS